MRAIHVKSLSVSALLLLATFVLAFLRAGAYLASPGGAPRRADAIVILGGNDEPRSIVGLELYRAKAAPLVLLTVSDEKAPSPGKYSGDLRARALMAGGVSEGVVEFVCSPKNSWQEAESTLKLAKVRDWHMIIVVSDPPHMRRLKWAWGRVLNGSGVGFALVPSSPSWWHADKWWMDKVSAEFVLTEYVKLVYYFFKYRFK